MLVPGLSSVLVIFILVLTLIIPFVKGSARKHLETVILIACTAGTCVFFAQITKAESKAAIVRSKVSEERAESALRLMSIVNVGVARVYEQFAPLHDASGKVHSAIDVSKTGLSSTFKTAEDSLKEAIKANPENSELKAKLLVLLSCSGKKKDLLKSTCKQLRESKNDEDRELGNLFWEIYLQKSSKALSAGELKEKVALIEKGISKGWYQDFALLELYKTARNDKQYKQFSRELEDRYSTSFGFGIVAMTVGCLSAFVGLVVIIIQLGSLGRRQAQATGDAQELKVSFRNIYLVFVGWITRQLVIGEALKLLPKNALALGANPLGIAVFSFLSYLITMIPAVLLIYFVALKPLGRGFREGLGLRFRTQSMGPFKLVLSGFLSWCAIIPLVLIASLVSGTQGSDNPVLSQIALVTSSKNLLAISVLLITVAVAAPIFEEIIFRGFLYAALKVKIGIFPAILVSAVVFAGIHMDKGGAVMLFALGPVLALAYQRTRSLIPSILAHGIWNGCAFCMFLLLFFS